MQDGHLAENKNACRVFLIERREKKERKERQQKEEEEEIRYQVKSRTKKGA